jgi:protoporphyrinogen oxidase
MFLNKENVFNFPWIYFSESGNPDLLFNRIYEVGSFSREMLCKEKEAICLEITCYKDDQTWQTSDKELFKKCIGYLSKHGFVKEEEVVEFLTKRIEVAYPVFTRSYRDRVSLVLDYLLEGDNIFCIGRQGLFSYSNIDHCIDMALKLDDMFAAGPGKDEFLKKLADYIPSLKTTKKDN